MGWGASSAGSVPHGSTPEFVDPGATPATGIEPFEMERRVKPLEMPKREKPFEMGRR